MKKTKILSLILAVIFVFSAISLVACDSSTNSTSDSPTEAPIEKPTEKPTHTEHEGAGICSVCGINYLDTLASYVKENGVPVEVGGKIANYTIYTVANGYKYSITTYTGDNYKSVDITEGHGDYSGLWTELSIDSSSIKYGEYFWTCYYGWGGHVEGLLFASTTSPSRASTEYKSSTFDSDKETGKAQSHADNTLTRMISDVLIPLLEKCDKDLTPSDFGFERFE